MAVFPKFYRYISLTHCLSSPPENLLGISNMFMSKFKLLILHYPSIFKLHFSIWHYWLFQPSSCLDKNAGVFLECFIFSYIQTVRKHQMLNPPQKISRNMSTICLSSWSNPPSSLFLILIFATAPNGFFNFYYCRSTIFSSN